MYGLKELLVAEEKRLRIIKEEVDRRLIDAPEGFLRIASSKKQQQYMYCTNDSETSRKQGRYIRKEEMELVRSLAQKAYDVKIQRLVEKRLKQISKLSCEYREDEIENVYLSEHVARRAVIAPVEKTWEQVLREWLAEPYTGKEFGQGAIEIYTKRGERVRSKSEKILADTFYDRDIPYKYECPLYLREMGTVYPDFTFLDWKTGKEIYWEHDGRMDDPQYAEKAVRKIDAYIKNGIYPGERLIVSYETSGYVMNQKVINAMIEKYLQ